MADPLSVAASVTALVTIAAQLSKLSWELLSDARTSSRDQKTLLREIKALADAIELANSACEDARVTGVPIRWPSTLNPSTITECRINLMSLQAELQAGMSRVKWLFQEHELRRRVESVREFRTAFLSFVATNTATTTTLTLRQVDKITHESTRKSLLDTLEHIETSRQLPVALPNTGQWLVESQKYQDWLRDDPSILFCHGAPGVGKSLLASVATRDLACRQNSDRCLVAFYFCDFAASKQQDLSAILRSILRHVVRSVDEKAVGAIQKLMPTAPQDRTPSMLARILKEACKLVHRLYLVVDALDELDPNVKKKLLSVLGGLAQAGGRILITSRESAGLAKTVLGANCMKIEANYADLTLYVSHRLRESDMFSSERSIEDVANTIVQKANQIFLHARLIVDRTLEHTSVKQMKKALLALPEQLDQLFETTLERINAQSAQRCELAIRTIGWLTRTKRRLRYEEISHAFAVEEDEMELDEDNAPALETILQVCCGIVVLGDDGYVGMVHETAHTFFSSQLVEGVHEDLAYTCLRYLALNTFRNGPCESSDMMEQRLSDMHFLSYAAQNWGYHVHCSAGTKAQTGPLVMSLLQDEEVRWAAFQAMHYRISFANTGVSDALLNSIPTTPSALHVAAHCGLRYTAKSLIQSGHELSARDSQDWTPLHWAARSSSFEVMELLLQADSTQANACDSQGWTPLFWAGFNGDRKAAELLVTHGADELIEDIHGWLPLSWAMRSAAPSKLETVEYLVDVSIKISDKLIQSRNLVSQYSLSEIRAFLKRRALVVPTIETAAALGDAPLLDMLLKHCDNLGIKVCMTDLWATGKFDVPVGNIWRTVSKAEQIHGIDEQLGRKWNMVPICDIAQSETPKGLTSIAAGLLHQALRNADLTAVQMLVELGTDPQPHLLAATHRKDPRFLAALMCSPTAKHIDSEVKSSVLRHAIVNGFRETASVMIEVGAEVHTTRTHKGIEGVSALMLACGYRGGDDWETRRSIRSDTLPCTDEANQAASSMVRELLALGAVVNHQNAFGMTALHYAAQSGHLDIVKQLLAKGACVLHQSHDSVTPLHFAAAKFDLNIVQHLLLAGADATQKDACGRSMLHWLALSINQISNTDPKLKTQLKPVLNTFKNSAGDAAINLRGKVQISGRGFPTCTAHLFLPIEEATAATMALAVGHFGLFDLLWHEGCKLDDVDVDQMLRSNLSSRYWRLGPDLMRTVSLLGIDNAYALKHISMQGLHCFFDEAHHTESEVADYVVKLRELTFEGLDLNSRGIRDHTLLEQAVVRGYSGDVVEYLLMEHGANRLTKDKHGQDALLRALLANQSQHVRRLLAKYGTDAKSFSEQDLDPADVKTDPVSRACTMIKDKGGIDHMYEDGSLLCMAAERGNEDLVKELLLQGAAVDSRTQRGWTPLHMAARKGHAGVVQSLIAAGADCNDRGAEHKHCMSMSVPGNRSLWLSTPLHLAATEGRVEVVQTLLNAGVSISTSCIFSRESGYSTRSASDSLAPTALHLALGIEYHEYHYRREEKKNPAVKQANMEVAQLLVNYGAEVAGVADHLSAQQVLGSFEHHAELWDTIRAGCTHRGCEMPNRDSEGVGRFERG